MSAYKLIGLITLVFALLISTSPLLSQKDSESLNNDEPLPGIFSFPDISTGRSDVKGLLTRCMIKVEDGSLMSFSDGSPAIGTVGYYNRKMTFFDNGAEHIFASEETELFKHTFESDTLFPLTFKLVADMGYVYLCGKGNVTTEDGEKISFGNAMNYDQLSLGLKSSDQLIREGSAQGLGYLSDERAVTDLIAAMNDPSYEVRRNSTEALGRLGSETSIQALKEQVISKSDLSEIAIWALSKCGDKGIAELSALLIRTDILKQLDDIAETLGASKNDLAFEALVSASKNTSVEIRKASISGLQEFGGDNSLIELKRISDTDEDEAIKKAATKAINKLENKK